MEYSYQKFPGFNLHLIKTNKFKTIDLTIKLIEELDFEKATLRSLLPYVLKAKTDNITSKQEMSKKLENLYGSSIGVSTSKLGNASIITLNARFCNPRFVTSKNLLLEIVLLIKEILLSHKSFSRDVLDEEKRLLKDEIVGLNEDKTRFAIKRLFEIMCKDEKYSITPLGYLSFFESINEKSLYDYYQDVLYRNQMEIIVNGSYTSEDISLIANNFSFRSTNSEYLLLDLEKRIPIMENYIKENEDINQTKINLGFRTPILIDDLEYYSMFLANAILGGYQHSFLFRSLREESSLCYYIASRYDAIKGIILIYAGVDPSNESKSIELIKKQIKIMQDGLFSEEIINITKKMIKNDLLESLDSQGALTSKAIFSALLNKEFDVLKRLDMLNSVSKEDIVKAINKIKLDTIYVLGR